MDWGAINWDGKGSEKNRFWEDWDFISDMLSLSYLLHIQVEMVSEHFCGCKSWVQDIQLKSHEDDVI